MHVDNAKRTGKETVINDDANPLFRTIIGTLDRYNPSVIYIRSKTCVHRNGEGSPVKEAPCKIRDMFTSTVKEMIRRDDRLENRHICTIEMSDRGIESGKKTNVKYDIYIKPSESTSFDDCLKLYSIYALRFNDILNMLIKDNGLVTV